MLSLLHGRSPQRDTGSSDENGPDSRLWITQGLALKLPQIQNAIGCIGCGGTDCNPRTSAPPWPTPDRGGAGFFAESNESTILHFVVGNPFGHGPLYHGG